MVKHENEYVVPDERYYLYKYVLKNKAFLDRIAAYKETCCHFGHPIPPKGFSSEKHFKNWVSAIGRDFYNLQKQPIYQQELRKITRGKVLLTPEASAAVDELEKHLLPPYPYFEPLNEILRQTFPNRKIDEDDFDFIVDHVFFGRLTYRKNLLAAKFEKNDNGEKELWIRIYPYTRKHHLMNWWKQVQEMQKQLPDYKSRHTQPRYFDRDMRIEELKASAAQVKEPEVEKSDYIAILNKAKADGRLSKEDHKSAVQTYKRQYRPDEGDALDRTADKIKARDIGRKVSKKPMTAGAVRVASSRTKKRSRRYI